VLLGLQKARKQSPDPPGNDDGPLSEITMAGEFRLGGGVFLLKLDRCAPGSDLIQGVNLFRIKATELAERSNLLGGKVPTAWICRRWWEAEAGLG